MGSSKDFGGADRGRSCPPPPKPPTLAGAWVSALVAFATLCDRTNIGGMTASETQQAIGRLRLIRRDLRHTPVG